jgi:hypothetical protein
MQGVNRVDALDSTTVVETTNDITKALGICKGHNSWRVWK